MTDPSRSLFDVTDLLLAIQAKVRATYHSSGTPTTKDKWIQSYLTRNLLFELKQNSMSVLAVRNVEALHDFFLWQTLFSLETKLRKMEKR